MKKLIGLISVVLCFCFIFSSCKGNNEDVDDTKPSKICILLGKTENVKAPNLNMFTEMLTEAASNQSECSVIILDGTPNEITVQYTFPDLKSKLEDNRVERAKNNIKKFTDEINNVSPDSTEIDIIKGLNSAKKILTSTESENTLIIYSSGLSTTGILNFAERPDLLYKEPAEIVEKLKVENAIADLKGINVVWYGLGNVEEPQKELSYAEQDNLKAIWSAILEACNVDVTESTFVDAVSVSNEEKSDIDFPDVSIVNLFDSDDGVWDLDEETIGFVANSAEFLNRDETIKKLVPYANLMIASNKKFYIVGSTATHGNYNKCIELSHQRAQAIKDVLVELNVPETSMQIFGIGQENLGNEYAWRVNDLNDSKELIPTEAQKNRKVMIIDATSKQGEEFIEDWEASKLSE